MLQRPFIENQGCLHSRSVSTYLDFSTVVGLSGAIERKKKLPLVNRKIIWHPEFRFELKEQKGQTGTVDLRNAERYFPGIGGKRKSLSSQASPRIELGTFANECNFTLSLEELKQFVLR